MSIVSLPTSPIPPGCLTLLEMEAQVARARPVGKTRPLSREERRIARKPAPQGRVRPLVALAAREEPVVLATMEERALMEAPLQVWTVGTAEVLAEQEDHQRAAQMDQRQQVAREEEQMAALVVH